MAELSNFDKLTKDERRDLVSKILDQYRSEVLQTHEIALQMNDVGSTEYYRALARSKSVAVYRLSEFK